jgi:hypothetical protein
MSQQSARTGWQAPPRQQQPRQGGAAAAAAPAGGSNHKPKQQQQQQQQQQQKPRQQQPQQHQPPETAAAAVVGDDGAGGTAGGSVWRLQEHYDLVGKIGEGTYGALRCPVVVLSCPITPALRCVRSRTHHARHHHCINTSPQRPCKCMPPPRTHSPPPPPPHTHTCARRCGVPGDRQGQQAAAVCHQKV